MFMSEDETFCVTAVVSATGSVVCSVLFSLPEFVQEASIASDATNRNKIFFI